MPRPPAPRSSARWFLRRSLHLAVCLTTVVILAHLPVATADVWDAWALHPVISLVVFLLICYWGLEAVTAFD